MLKETVIRVLRAEFGDKVQINPESREFAVFAAKHPSVGNIMIDEDNGELVVSVGAITHSHFASYDEGLSEAEHADCISRDLVEFLVDLFADKYFFYKARWSSGWTHVDNIKESDIKANKEWFKWSGPIDRSVR